MEIVTVAELDNYEYEYVASFAAVDSVEEKSVALNSNRTASLRYNNHEIEVHIEY